jgi:hypothetical protein
MTTIMMKALMVVALVATVSPMAMAEHMPRHEKGMWGNATPEQKAEWKAKKDAMTPAQKAEWEAKKADCKAKWDKATPEQKAEWKNKHAEHKAQWDAMTPAERKEWKNKHPEFKGHHMGEGSMKHQATPQPAM